MRCLYAVAARLRQRLTRTTGLTPGADGLVFLDIDAEEEQVHGRARQGVRRARTGLRCPDHLVVPLSGPRFAPLILGTRLRHSAANSARTLTPHLPQHRPWAEQWAQLFTTTYTHVPPYPA